ncbi:MAG: cbb3-type cytochrome oxidase assembly protein CcoS [Rhodocyclaceae bacterium]|nr:cbb3-type cytochrome oxidase assembly protein CcoS [Rhodocyclaceae bacterium]MBX3668314.1 cbb3-type cytochrome oxidase assembly protein CcoS [Rhodocyclaceae bacterium]
MEILYLLIPLSVVLVFLIGVIFWWSLRSGQFDDLEGPAYRVVMDDDRPAVDEKAPESSQHPERRDGDMPG